MGLTHDEHDRTTHLDFRRQPASHQRPLAAGVMRFSATIAFRSQDTRSYNPLLQSREANKEISGNIQWGHICRTVVDVPTCPPMSKDIQHVVVREP